MSGVALDPSAYNIDENSGDPLQQVADQRAALWAAGFRPLEVYSKGKRPKGMAWQIRARQTPPDAVQRAPKVDALSTGILADGLRPIDVDVDDDDAAAAICNVVFERFGPAPMRSRSNSPRCTILYRAAEGAPGKKSVIGAKGKVEALGLGQQFVAYGTHPSGAEIEWSEDLAERGRDGLPAITEDALDAFLLSIHDTLGVPTATATEHPQPQADLEPADIAELEELVGYIPASCGYHEWLDVLMALHAATGGDQAGLDLADRWSATGGKMYAGSKQIEKKWRSFQRSGINVATLAEIARQHGANLSEIAFRHRIGSIETPDDGFDAERLEVGKSEPQEAKIAASAGDPEPTPAPSIDYPPGLVGDIAKWIVAGAWRPQPSISIGAGLIAVGTAAGRLYRGPEGAATHLYVLGLAPTGCGKDHPLQMVPRLLDLAGLSQHIGPSEFISMPAVVDFLKDKPLSACAMDEVGDFLRRINDRRASGFERSISKVIRSLWSLGYKPYATPQWAQKASQTIHAPAMSLFGASTFEQFYNAMSGGSLEDGTLNRFITVGSAVRPPRKRPPPFDLHGAAALAKRLEAVYTAAGDFSGSWRNNPSMNPENVEDGLIELEWGTGAKERFEEISDDLEDRMFDPSVAPFITRVMEQSVRLATIVAIGKGSSLVSCHDLEWGYSLASQSATFMQVGFQEYGAETEFEALTQRIVRTLKERGGRASHRDITRAIRTVKAKDIREALETLVDAGKIRAVEQQSERRGGHKTYNYEVIG